MDAFKYLTGFAAPLPETNIDTDIIFPARFLLITAKKGLGRYAFRDWRQRPDGAEIPDFVLNREPFRRASILVGGDNFGCGSSREQAPWALYDMGVRCIISTSFGEIFYSNCFKNGMLPIVVKSHAHAMLLAYAQTGREMSIDLAEQTIVRFGSDPVHFTVEPWRREALLNGWDEIAIVLNRHAGETDQFETRQRAAQPWLYAQEQKDGQSHSP